MIKGIYAITRGHELVEMKEVEYPDELRETLELMEGYSFPMYGEYEGCKGEFVGFE